ncbi:MAG: hypothetical protein MHM6MM_008928, partial [Cercozoa sp. M6MM]
MSDDESSWDEVEPKLKYIRLENGLEETLKRTRVSCMAVHPKFLVVGTADGEVSVLDLHGFLVSRRRTFQTKVTTVTISDNAEFVGCASDAGLVVIYNLYDDKDSQVFSYPQAVNALTLHPQYTSSPGTQRERQTFVCGGVTQELIQNSRGWFSHKDVVLHAGEGEITAIAWAGTLLAWANDVGVKMFDTSTRERVALVNRPGDPAEWQTLGPHKPHLVWEDLETLLIAWGQWVQIVKVERIQLADSDKTAWNVSIAASFKLELDFEDEGVICGIAPVREWLIVLLRPHDLQYIDEDELEEAVNDDVDEDEITLEVQKPKMLTITRDGRHVCGLDSLPIHKFE